MLEYYHKLPLLIMVESLSKVVLLRNETTLKSYYQKYCFKTLDFRSFDNEKIHIAKPI